MHVRPLAMAPSYAIAGILSWGSYAQYMVVHERWLVRDDTGLSPELVATLPMTLLTAVHAVKVVGEVRDGVRVLIHAGAGTRPAARRAWHGVPTARLDGASSDSHGFDRYLRRDSLAGRRAERRPCRCPGVWRKRTGRGDSL